MGDHLRVCIGLDSVPTARVADVLHAIAYNQSPLQLAKFVSVSLGDNCRLQPQGQFATISEV